MDMKFHIITVKRDGALGLMADFLAGILKVIAGAFTWLFSLEIRVESYTAALLEKYIKTMWAYLGVAGPNGKPLRIAIFGAGLHTEWLHLLAKGNKASSPEVVALLDSRKDRDLSYWGLSPIPPEALDINKVDAILISSDTVQEQMKAQCKLLYGDRLPVIDPYEYLPPGPYIRKCCDRS